MAKPVGISKGFQVVWYIPACPNGSFHMYSCAHENTHPCLPSTLKLVSWQLCRVITEPLVLILIVVLQVTLATCRLLFLAFNVQSVLQIFCFEFCNFVVFETSFLCGSADKETACNAGDLGLIPGLGRSPGEGKSYPLQYSGLESQRVGHHWESFTSH